MAVKYQDYYETLGVDRKASQQDIHNAYRKLARKYHPDVNKTKEAEQTFKEINEAYEVLKDPEKRRKYDALGQNWHNGDDFTPPPGWENFGFGGSGGGSGGFGGFGDMFRGFDIFGGGDDQRGSTGFSDFFESLFGGAFGGLGGQEGAGGRSGPGRGSAGTTGQGAWGGDVEAEVSIPLEEAYRGGKKTITLQQPGGAPGTAAGRRKNIEVNIPPGITDGRKLRLAGQGSPSYPGGPAGDLYLTIRLQPHSRFRVNGADLEIDVPLTPWEAALGAKVQVPLVDGTASISVPPGTQSGKRFRLRGKGLKKNKTESGDLYAVAKIVVPERLGSEERELFEKLGRVSGFKPRG